MFNKSQSNKEEKFKMLAIDRDERTLVQEHVWKQEYKKCFQEQEQNISRQLELQDFRIIASHLV